jgi:two-component system, OmpR family, sensor kinase
VIRRSSVRWRLVAWVTGVLLIACAAIFAVIYQQATAQLRSQIDADVRGDVSQLSQAVGALNSDSPHAMTSAIRRYMRSQPFTGTSSLLFAVIPGEGTVNNHPELFGAPGPEHGETAAAQLVENRQGRSLLAGPLGLSTRRAPDLGDVRMDERAVQVGNLHVRVGAGEPLIVVARAQHSIARSFLIAGAVALALALIASYLAGASVTLPLRRMAKVAARVDDGDLDPRMHVPATASTEIRVLAETFNNMLDRLQSAFAAERDFLADASHELRTPLTVIAGQVEVLAAQAHPSSEELRRVQQLVSAEIARTSRLVDDMLLLSRAQRSDFLRRRPTELSRFIEDLWTGMTTGVQRRFELSEIPQHTLMVDPDRLAQALRNLIRNAIEHTAPPSGLVRLEVDRLSGGPVRFSVLDDGPGIDAEQQELIFERFHRTDSARDRASGGAGLGLAIVQAIAEAHGGRVRASTWSGGGAKLELELPSQQSAAIPERRPLPALQTTE